MYPPFMISKVKFPNPKIPVLALPNGDLNSMTFQFAPVNKILAAVSRITSHKCKVGFDEPHIGSHIENKTTGKITSLRQNNGVYYLDVWYKPGEELQQGFPRHPDQ